MVSNLTAVVIGCGRMGAGPSSRLQGQVPEGWLPYSHTESLLAASGVDLVGLCDSRKDAIDGLEAVYPQCQFFSDYKEAIDQLKPDIITVATRTPSKFEILDYAMKHAVRGIYVEKPLANSLEQVVYLTGLARSTGTELYYGVNRRFHETYVKARDLLSEGCIGQLRTIVVEHGLSQIFWSHPHSTDLVTFLSGCSEVSSIQASCSEDSVVMAESSGLKVDSDPVLESAYILMDSGVRAYIVASAGLSVRLGGDLGSMVVLADGAMIQVNKSKPGASTNYFPDMQIVELTPKKSATVNAFESLVSQVNGSLKPPGITLKEMEAGSRMLFGCVWSHLQGGLRVDPNAIPTDLIITGRTGELYA
ncbi:MAG: Gfo/Idh/MocA family oxidoreductase [Cyanobacteria bacterium HKST-UBA01]|nr:Gfo/Idh/MocA family oxidoreductase [Cyanobacteria bacterium HKST-UBA01]